MFIFLTPDDLKLHFQINLHIVLHGAREKVTSSSLQFSFIPSPIPSTLCFFQIYFLMYTIRLLVHKKGKCLPRFPAFVSISSLCFGSFSHKTNPSCSTLPSNLKTCIYILVRFCCTACMNIGRMRDNVFEVVSESENLSKEALAEGSLFLNLQFLVSRLKLFY